MPGSTRTGYSFPPYPSAGLLFLPPGCGSLAQDNGGGYSASRRTNSLVPCPASLRRGTRDKVVAIHSMQLADVKIVSRSCPSVPNPRPWDSGTVGTPAKAQKIGKALSCTNAALALTTAS